MTEAVTVEPSPSASMSSGARPPLRPLIAVVGNPNVGKTTLFNRLTGQNARVGNYPGVTVERRMGKLTLPSADDETTHVDLVDVPGAYSLSARSPEEQIALHAVLGLDGNPRPALVLVVVDAGQLIRNLYLALQLAELRVPMVIALNMIDETGENPPSATAVAQLFGVPCVATNARRGAGLDALREEMGRALQQPPLPSVSVNYPRDLVRDIDRIAEHLPPELSGSVERRRALALWALSSVESDDELTGLPDPLRSACLELRDADPDRDLDLEVIAARYELLDGRAASLYGSPRLHPPKRAATERVDRVLLHPVYGFAIFVLIMLLLFQALFSWADPAIGAIETLFGGLGETATRLMPEGVLRDLVTEGLISGVGNVVVFLPQILLLFFFIGLLEDSGYMARVAYLMDRVMRSLGLHGRAFVPMLSGFACAVPAILATRTMERRRDRLLTMLVIPLMTCSARLPVYTLIIGALFPPTEVFGLLPVQGLLMVAMYLFSTTIALIAAGVLGRTVVKGRRVPLILELPPYRTPSLGGVLRMMWERTSLFLREAGTVILFFTIVLWGLLSFPRGGVHDAAPPAQVASTTTAESAPATPSTKEERELHARKLQLEGSYAGRLGKAIEPALQPLGFDWKIGVGLIGAFAAREVFVSTMGIVYDATASDEDTAALRDRIRAETKADGAPVYSPLVGLSLMVFFALACQCMSTLAVVRRETASWRWPAFLFVYMTALAWIASFAVYQGGRALGF